MAINRAAVLCLIFLLVTSQTMFYFEGSRAFKYRVQSSLGSRSISFMATQMLNLELPRRYRKGPYGLRRTDELCHF